MQDQDSYTAAVCKTIGEAIEASNSDVVWAPPYTVNKLAAVSEALGVEPHSWFPPRLSAV